MHHNFICAACGKQFYRQPSRLKEGTAQYCSHKCHGATLRRPDTYVERTCERCGKVFTMRRCWLERDGPNSGRFCSRACRKPPLDEIVRRMDHMGYVAIRINGKWTHEHRVVAEEKIGRALQPGETVHHLNRIKTDNRPENLEVLLRPDHQRMHYKEKFPLAAGEWGSGREKCAQCGGTDYPHKAFGLCLRCYCRNKTLEHNPNAITRQPRRKS